MAASSSKFKEENSSSGNVTRLSYDVVEWSSYSPGYHPKLIKENKPDDLTSRWLSESGRPPQHVTLQLSHPAIVTEAVFGKYCRPHACNVHKLKIMGGMNSEYLVRLAEGELKNDGCSETIALRHTLKNGPFPCLYVKIVLLDTWGQTNFSLWHVDLLGITDPSIVKGAAHRLKEFQQEEAVRLCLKHLRQNDYQEAFASLQKQAHLDLEHPLLTELHHELVQEGDYTKAELIFTRAVS
ncbi:PREDICTED: muskelin-like, partial [Amphimedon queenslandica]